MIDKLTRFIYSAGDWNHAIVSVGSMLLSSIIVNWLGFNAVTFVWFQGVAWSFFYLGKEHWTYIHLGELGSFNMFKWDSHDRRQTLFMWASVWIYVFLFEYVFIHILNKL